MCSTLADQGKRVIVAGLDQDYLGKPFEPMPQLLAIAEYITKTLAICMVCGAPANHTQRLVASSERVLVGAQGTYEARCRHCFDPRSGVSADNSDIQGQTPKAIPSQLRLKPCSRLEFGIGVGSPGVGVGLESSTRHPVRRERPDRASCR